MRKTLNLQKRIIALRQLSALEFSHTLLSKMRGRKAKNMLNTLELGVALAILAQLSAGQSMVTSIYYHKINIEASSWSDIRAHTLTG